MKGGMPKDTLAARIEDMCGLAVKRGRPVFSPFLNESEQYLAGQFLKNRSGIKLCFWGGDDACIRKMLCVMPDDASEVEDAVYDDFPIYAVTISFRKADKPGHRDILGAVMGLGIERDTVGDIFIGEGAAAVFCTKTASELMCDQLTSVGRIGVSVFDGLNENAAAAVKPAACADITVNVASVRTDCIVSGITGLSREKAAAFIRSGSFMLNYEECDSVSRNVTEGDVLTLRGYGKFVVSGDQANTKKGRIRLIIKKYI